MTAMAMYYDPKEGYKYNLIFNVMNFNEILKNWSEKNPYKMTCMSAIKSPRLLK